MAQEKKYDVFISYSTKDSMIAKDVCDYLENHRIRCFVAERDIPKTVQWADAIPAALRDSKMMLAIFSGFFQKSERTSREVSIAAKRKIPILTFRITDDDFEGVKEYFLAELNWIDAFPEPRKSFVELLNSIVLLINNQNQISDGGQLEDDSSVAVKERERIFISYKRVDRERVFAIKDGIERATGEKCWIDLDGIESDAQFADVIISAINRCEVFLFMYSASHTKIVNRKKDWTIREISFAEKKDKRIVFVNIDNSPLTDWFELNFGTTQQVDATDTEKLAHLHNDLCSWLKIDIRKSQQDSYKDASKAEQDRLRKERELQERIAQAEAEKKALEEKMRLAEEKVRQAEEKARQAEERRKAEEKRQAEARKEAEEEANQTERRRKAEELTREYFLWKQQSEKKQPIGVSRMSTHGLSNANIKKVNDKCDNLAEHLSYEYNDANMTATVTGHKLSSDVIGCINIPEKVIYKGKYYTVNQIGKNAFFYCSSLTSVLIPNTITTIGVQAFNKCTSLKSVTISKCLNSIGWRAFCGCKSLTSIVLPNSLMTIEDEAFSGCSSLQSIFIPAGQKVRFLRMKGLQYYERLLVDSQEQCKALELEESIISIDDLRSKAYAYFSRRNYAEAVKWYRQAAELGDPFSQYTLANLYVDGHGVDKNLTEAKKWYQKAAEHGHAEAIKKIYELGTIAESKQSIKGYDNSKSVDVILKSAGVNKLQVVKTIKEQIGYGLKESKDIVDAAPSYIKRNVNKEIAVAIKKELDEVGAFVELYENSKTFDVILKSAGACKLLVVKIIKEQTGLGLKESKDIVDAAPSYITRNVDKVMAETIKKELEKVGASVEIR